MSLFKKFFIFLGLVIIIGSLDASEASKQSWWQSWKNWWQNLKDWRSDQQIVGKVKIKQPHKYSDKFKDTKYADFRYMIGNIKGDQNSDQKQLIVSYWTNKNNPVAELASCPKEGDLCPIIKQYNREQSQQIFDRLKNTYQYQQQLKEHRFKAGNLFE